MVMISDLVRIAAAGGGLRINCHNKMVSDLVRISAAGSENRSVIILEHTDRLLVSDKVRIAAAGKGCVFFNDEV